MFGELPKLFDRNFALGYFLPSAMYLAATFYLLDRLNLHAGAISTFQKDLLVGTTTVGLMSWLIGIFLLGANRSIFRFLEGYGKYNPVKLLLRFEKRKYEKQKSELELLNVEYDKLKKSGDVPHALRMKRNELTRSLVERFPDEPGWILPTSFGNVIRAFEVYPRVVYGIEGIQGWNRLLAVVPKDYRQLVDDAKAQVDFWVNVGVLSLVFAGQYAGLSICSGHAESLWLPVFTLFLAAFAACRAERSALQWGESVKSAFDVFLPRLKKELELVASSGDERKAWTQFSQMIIYRISKK